MKNIVDSMAAFFVCCLVALFIELGYSDVQTAHVHLFAMLWVLFGLFLCVVIGAKVQE